MRLLDTNIILYAAGRPHRYKVPCARLLQEVAEGSTDYTIDTELLQEVLYVYTSRGERARGLATFDDLLRLFPFPIAIGREEMVAARHLLERYPALSPRDAVHAAAVLTQDLEGIVTTDGVFRQVAGLVVVEPAEPASDGT
ncbi:MAG: type II toxin-antitoxin system VapC family toxin [Chloroflexi bacterium]|nr:type II toxin-antitoxin system VapC family toxin [Chloroflexota bacterium]